MLINIHRRGELKKKLTKNLDVSSPENPLLDTESLGMNTRKTRYTIYSTGADFFELAITEGREIDLIANLIHGAMEVIELDDPIERGARRAEFQSLIFTTAQRLFLENNFSLFSFYNRKIISKISEKIQPKKFELISSLITQPILRVAVENRAIRIDANAVLSIIGVDGFRKNFDLYKIEIWNLNGKNLDSLFDYSYKGDVKGRRIHFDIVRVFHLVWDNTEGELRKISTPIIAGSKWTLKRLLTQTINKKSEVMLEEVFRRFPDMVPEMFAFCHSRHSITGMAKYPWAIDVIDCWRRRNDGGPHMVSGIPQLRASRDMSSHPNCLSSITGTPQPRILSRLSKTYLIDSAVKLTELKRKIKNADHPLIGISIPHSSMLSMACGDETFLIDNRMIEEKILSFFLKKILSQDDLKKAVFSLNTFLNDAQELTGEAEIEFCNVVEIRGVWRKRSMKVNVLGEERIEDLVNSVSCPGVDGLEIPKSINFTKTTEHVEYMDNRGENLRELCMHFMEIDHDRKLCFSNHGWDIRPMTDEYLTVASNDSYLLVQLVEKWSRLGFTPVEELSFDPFE